MEKSASLPARLPGQRRCSSFPHPAHNLRVPHPSRTMRWVGSQTLMTPTLHLPLLLRSIHHFHTHLLQAGCVRLRVNRNSRSVPRCEPAHSTIHRLLLDQWRPLVEVAVSDPSRTDNEVSNSRPALPRGSIEPRSKVNIFVPLQFLTLRQKSLALKLHRLLARPANDEARSGIGREVSELASRVQRVENNFKLLSHRNPHQRRLRKALRRNTPQHRQFAARHKLKQLRLRHAQEDTPNLRHHKG